MTAPAAGGVAVSVVIPNWNGEDVLGPCLEALARQRFRDFETIVVDNGSTDASLEVVARVAPDAVVVRRDGNDGFAVAANAGAQTARGRFVAFLNSDVEPDAPWLAELVACLERHPRAASAAPKLLRRSDRTALDGAGDALTRSLKAYRRGEGERDRGQYDVEEPIFAAPGTASLWRVDAFRALGGFDEELFAYYEDVDLGLRARAAGFEAWLAPAAVALHRRGAASAGAAREFECFHAVRNRWRMVIGNVPTRWLAHHAHVIVLGELASFGRSVSCGGGRRHLAAYVDVCHSFRRLRAGRSAERCAATGDVLQTWALRRFPPRSSSAARRAGARAAARSIAAAGR